MKKILKVLIPFLLCLLLVLPVSAEQLPENNILNKELTVEKDSNIIEDNLNGRREDDFVIEETTTIFMSPKECLRRITLPALFIFSSGLLLFFAFELKDRIQSKKDS